MKITTSLALFLMASGLTTGCATITKDANQSVQIETYSKDNQPVTGVTCVAQNDRGQWSVTTPGAVSVHRSGENLLINCEKEGIDLGHGTVISRANGSMFGNILFGGGVGAIIDHNKGTAYTYPAWLRIVMGDKLIYDKKDDKENTVMLGKSGTDSTELTTAATQPEANQEQPGLSSGD